MGVEQPSTYYDKGYSEWAHYRSHYTCSQYYKIGLWSEAVKILHQKVGMRASLLDLGCGTGQMAQLLLDEGFVEYVGIDFSEVAITSAQNRINDTGFTFLIRDLFSPQKLQAEAYLCLEVLEHIEEDVSLFTKLDRGSLFIGSVPNFNDPGHVRIFSSENEVRKRYNSCLENMEIRKFSQNKSVWYLFWGEVV